MNQKWLTMEKLKCLLFLILFCSILWGFNNYWRHAIYHIGATFGNSTSMYALGDAYLKENRIGEAEYWLSQAAERGNFEAQKILGEFYLNPGSFGIDGEPQYAEAVKWLRKVAEQGDASAQSNLGGCYYAGKGVEQSYIEAVKWFRKAAEQGDAGAQYKLGTCYYNGCGVEKSHAEAIKWYSKAAEQGYPGAQQKLTEVKERLTPKTCTKCSGKGAVIVPAKKCDNCTNGTVEMPCECSLGKYDPRRSFYQGQCINGSAGVYPNPRVRWGYLSKKNQKNLLDCKRISKDDETLDAKTIFEMNFNFADRFDDRQFLRNLDSQGISSRLGRNLGCLHIVYCMDYHFKKKKLFGKYKCENLNNLVQNVQSDSKCNNYCDKCKLCNKCGGNILCNICQGRLVRYEDCKNCENGYVSQSEEVACSQCGGDGKIEPEY